MGQIINKKTFKVQIDGKDVEFAAIRPNNDVATKAALFYNKSFRISVEEGNMVRASLESVLRKQNLWDDAKEADYQQARTTLLTGEMKLKKGGIKLSEAKKIAVDMRIARLTLQQLSAPRNELDQKTAEYYADNAKFNFLVSQCTVYADTGEKYFKDYEDYQSRPTDPVTQAAADALAFIIYEVQDDFEAKLPENKFLLKHKLCNKELHLVDKDGHPVDIYGRRVNENGKLINDKGQLIDSEGNLLTADGEYDVESVPFLDDDGKPIAEEVAKTEEPVHEQEKVLAI